VSDLYREEAINLPHQQGETRFSFADNKSYVHEAGALNKPAQGLGLEGHSQLTLGNG
jgi:hypothetical protein